MIRILYLFIATLLLASCSSDVNNPKAEDLEGSWKMVEMKDPDLNINIAQNTVTPNKNSKVGKARAEMMGNKVPDELKNTVLVFKDGKLTTQVKGKEKGTRGFVLRDKMGRTYLAVEPGIQQALIYIKAGQLYIADEANNAQAVWEKQ